jgi:hypothetical protein
LRGFRLKVCGLETVVGGFVHRGFESHPLRCRPGKCLHRAEFRRPGVDPSGASGGVSDRQRNRHFVAMPLPWALPRTVGCRRQDRTKAKRRNVSQRTLASLDEAIARFPRAETRGARPSRKRARLCPLVLQHPREAQVRRADGGCRRRACEPASAAGHGCHEAQLSARSGSRRRSGRCSWLTRSGSLGQCGPSPRGARAAGLRLSSHASAAAGREESGSLAETAAWATKEQ